MDLVYTKERIFIKWIKIEYVIDYDGMTYYQKQVLIAVYYSNDRSLSAHNPVDYIKKKMPVELKREKNFNKKF